VTSAAFLRMNDGEWSTVLVIRMSGYYSLVIKRYVFLIDGGFFLFHFALTSECSPENTGMTLLHSDMPEILIR